MMMWFSVLVSLITECYPRRLPISTKFNCWRVVDDNLTSKVVNPDDNVPGSTSNSATLLLLRHFS